MSFLNSELVINQVVIIFSILNLLQDEIHGVLFPASEDETMEVEHLLLEPQIEKDLSNNIMLMGSEHSKECLAIEDFTFAVDYTDFKADFGMIIARCVKSLFIS